MGTRLCHYCLVAPIAGRFRNHCSVFCRQRDRAQKLNEERNQLRDLTASRGFSAMELALYKTAEELMLGADRYALHYRLILHLVDGKPSRALINPMATPGRLIRFPEPFKQTHLDGRGSRRIGDYYTLRPFEIPAVPLHAFYEVELLGPICLGKSLEIPLSPKLILELPANGWCTSRWRGKAWGSSEIPAWQLRQQERRKEEKVRRFQRWDAALNGTPAPEPTEQGKQTPE